jgi:DNA-directed RNA polymerase specialized sigma24 family protein
MAYELWALDAEAREAVLQGEEGWILLSLDRGWQPLLLGGPDAALRWSLSRHVVPAEITYPSLQEALLEVRRVCATALRTKKWSAPDIQELLRAGLDPVERSFLDIVREFSGGLDRYFWAHGRSEDEAFDQTLDVLLTLRQEADWQSFDHHALALRLFKLAARVEGERARREVVREQPEAGEAEASHGGRDFAQERERRAFAKLTREGLKCLALWADGQYSTRDIAAIMGLSSERVEAEVNLAAEHLMRKPEELRGLRISQLSEQVLRTGGGSPRH